MDPLIEIEKDKWSILRDLYTNQWPEGAVAYCILDMQIKFPDLIKEFGFKVYCPEGNLNNGMIAVSLRNNYYQVIIQPMGANISKIEEALLKTKLVQWNRSITVPSANTVTIECLERIKRHLGLNVNYDDSIAYKHLLNKSTKRLDFIMPPDTYIGPLRPEHIEIVDKTWTYHSESSYSLFETLMKNHLTYVLYSLEENQPLAWITADSLGGLTHLYCLEKHRRKGYAEVVTKHAINEILERGQNVLAYTVEGNINPKKLFKKMGFKDIGHDYWVFVEMAIKVSD